MEVGANPLRVWRRFIIGRPFKLQEAEKCPLQIPLLNGSVSSLEYDEVVFSEEL
jgi:hypothetical protein